MEPEVPLGRVTLEDVRGAVEQLGGDPSRTNAAKVREVLGRGGYTTIQKHLEALRVEQERRRPRKGQKRAQRRPRSLCRGSGLPPGQKPPEGKERPSRKPCKRCSSWKSVWGWPSMIWRDWRRTWTGSRESGMRPWHGPKRPRRRSRKNGRPWWENGRL
ncbi:conserved hypothetical protein (plasmid) [Acidithiobacillus caldus SM-1]|uniref:KfrA N-terminal DNA-binding domain-containing protein n=1 Tax=Acidithiobacillus caldus (strain SM-1) TaxID=990288 RepID=F9ZUV6_ACICS|nr:conserved hypothetical protein [Acidithiobacillus caldus SM-1]